MKKNIIIQSLPLALGEIIYVFLVALIMRNGSQIFGNTDQFLAVAVFLLLFVLSAAISVILIFGRPSLLYLSGRKKEAIETLGSILGWLLIFIVLFFLILLFKFC